MIKFFAALALVAVVASAGTLPETRRVFGGKETTIVKIPYQVSLEAQHRHHCGGSIISEYWVLTAAHCLFPRLQDLIVRAGTANNAIGGTMHQIVEIIIHPGFERINLVNDIGLIRVANPFKFDMTRQPVTLYAQDEMTSEGATAVTSGWGIGSLNEHILNVIELSITPKRLCQAAYGFHPGQICAGLKEGGPNVCHGDSGGPLTVEGRLAGVVSGSIYYCRHFSKYAAVAYYRDWIKEQSGV